MRINIPTYCIYMNGMRTFKTGKLLWAPFIARRALQDRGVFFLAVLKPSPTFLLCRRSTLFDALCKS
jgi:hypothetical protein